MVYCMVLKGTLALSFPPNPVELTMSRIICYPFVYKFQQTMTLDFMQALGINTFKDKSNPRLISYRDSDLRWA